MKTLSLALLLSASNAWSARPDIASVGIMYAGGSGQRWLAGSDVVTMDPDTLRVILQDAALHPPHFFDQYQRGEYLDDVLQGARETAAALADHRQTAKEAGANAEYDAAMAKRQAAINDFIAELETQRAAQPTRPK